MSQVRGTQVTQNRDRLQTVNPARYNAEYFMTVCEGYQEFVHAEGKQLSRRLAQAFGVARIEPGMRVLDVGSGRGEIVQRCIELGAVAYGIDFASAANRIALRRIRERREGFGAAGFVQSDAKVLPFPARFFDRVLMFDIVEHLYPWELHQAYREAYRVLNDDGRLVIHTAPNRWYDRYAYPLVRLFRTLAGEGAEYPKNPREIIPANVDVHVNEQDMLNLPRGLYNAGFSSKIWLDSPPQNPQESVLLGTIRAIVFGVAPFRWFFERELFAVAWKTSGARARRLTTS